MHIYAVISITMLLLFLLEQNTKNNKLRMALFYLASFLAVGLLAFRGNHVGGDTVSYCGYFTGKGGLYGIFETNDSFEIGFITFCSLLMTVSRTEFWLIFATSLTTMLPFIYLIYRDSRKSRILPLCLYMTMWGILSVTQTALRQNLSVSLMMMVYIVYTSENLKQWNKYAVVAALLIAGFLSHTSSLVALPMFLGAFFLKLTKKRAYILVLGSFILVMAFKNLFGFIFDLFSQMMSGVEMASKMLGTYYQSDRYALENEISFNRLGPATFLVLLLIKMSNEEDLKSFYFKCLVVGASLYNVGATFPMIFRAVFVLLFFGIIYVPSQLNVGKYRVYRLLLILLIAFFIRNQIVYWAPNDGDKMLPYSFIWE